MGSCATVEEGKPAPCSARQFAAVSSEHADSALVAPSDGGDDDAALSRSSRYRLPSEQAPDPPESGKEPIFARGSSSRSDELPLIELMDPDEHLFETQQFPGARGNRTAMRPSPFCVGLRPLGSEVFPLLPSAPTSGSDVTVGPQSARHSGGVEVWLDEQLDSVGFQVSSRGSREASQSEEPVACGARTAGFNPHNLQAVLEAAAQMANRDLDQSTKRARKKINHALRRTR